MMTLVISSNFGCTSYSFRDMTHKARKYSSLFPSPPLFDASRKTTVMGLLYGENCIILSTTVFDKSTRVTDGRTDEAGESNALCIIMLLRAKNIKHKNYLAALLVFSLMHDFLPRDALKCKARYCDRMSSVCPSVRPSVCLSV